MRLSLGLALFLFIFAGMAHAQTDTAARPAVSTQSGVTAMEAYQPVTMLWYDPAGNPVPASAAMLPAQPRYNLRNFMRNRQQVKRIRESAEKPTLVVVRFTVDAKGHTVKPRIEQSAQPDMDQEVLRIVQEMPDWEPARLGATPIATEVVLPVSYGADLVGRRTVLITVMVVISAALAFILYTQWSS